MKSFISLFLFIATAASAAGNSLGTQTCKSVTKRGLIPEIVLAYRLDAKKKLAGIESVTVGEGKKLLGYDTFLTDATDKEASIAEFKPELDYGRLFVSVRPESGDLDLRLQSDDDGVALFAFLNTDGPIRASFFRCGPYPFES